MKKELTLINVILLFFAVYFCVVLVGLSLNYWSTIDYIALPLVDANFFISGDISYEYFLFLSLVDQIKGVMLDFLIMVGGYDLLLTFKYIVLAILCLTVVKYFIASGKVVLFAISICILSLIFSVQVTPGISKKDVDNAFFAYTENRKITTDFRGLLHKRDFEKLDAVMEQHENDYRNGVINVSAYSLGFTKFSESVQQEIAVLNEWVGNSKVPELALIVRADTYRNIGWKKRGIGFSRDTSDEQFAGMKKYFDLAIVDLNRSIEIDDENLYAHIVLIRVADMRMEKAEAVEIFDKTRQMFPDSYTYAYYHIAKLEPKWGGSLSEMHAVAKTYENEYVNNPLLVALKGLSLVAVADSEYLRKNYNKSVNLYKRALLYGQRQSVMKDVYNAYKEIGEYGKAAAIMTLCLDNHSGVADCYLNRAIAYIYENEWGKAKADLKNIENMELASAWEYQIAGWAYETIKENGAAVNYYMRASDMDNSNTYSLERLYTLSYHKYVSYVDVLPYMKRWTEIDPKKAEPWLKYADTLEDIDPVKSIPVYKQYLSLVDHNNKGNIELIEKVNQQIEVLTKAKY